MTWGGQRRGRQLDRVGTFGHQQDHFDPDDVHGGQRALLTEIARLAGLPISTAHRLTSELTSWRLLERTPDGLYRAGLPLRMMAGCPDRAPTLHERAPCVLEDLAAATRSRARVGVLQELEVAYIEKQPGHGRSPRGACRDAPGAPDRASAARCWRSRRPASST